VDEIYDTAVVQPLLLGSEQALWKTVDARVIDGSVNGAADSVSLVGHGLRRLQSGSVRVYATWLLVGLIVVLGFVLW
jgi:NADH-quinone oxidoreductase subunit L